MKQPSVFQNFNLAAIIAMELVAIAVAMNKD
jgi:hypothetical protein